MASLTGSTIASSYEQLLSLPDGGLDGNNLVAITDGDSSTAIGMKVATSKIEIIPGSNDANAFEVSQADGTAVLTVNTSTVGATLIGTLTVGENDTGHDVKFFGATATNGYMLWDESTDDLILGSASKMGIGETSPAVGLDVHWDNEISAGFGKATTDTNYISIRTLEEAGKIAGVAFMVGDTTQTGVSSTFQLAGVAGKVINANSGSALQGELGFYTNSGNSITQKMVLDKDGKVGIGTASPSNDFVVSNGGANGMEFGAGASASTLTVFNRSSSSYTPLTIEPSTLTIAPQSAVGLTVGAVADEADAIITNGADGGRYDVLTVQENGNKRWDLSFEGSGSTNSLMFASNVDDYEVSDGGILTLLPAGFIGLGHGDPKKMLHIRRPDTDCMIVLDAQDSVADKQICFAEDYGSGSTSGGDYWGVGVDASEGPDFVIAFDANSQASMGGDDDKMRISSGGCVGVGTSTHGDIGDATGILVQGGSSQTSMKFQVKDTHTSVSSSNVIGQMAFSGDDNADAGKFFEFADSGGVIGSISANGAGNTAFNTSSDERLKKDIEDVSDSLLDEINKIKVRKFQWNHRPANFHIGLIAQELEKIVPKAVNKGGDDPKKQPYSVAYSSLVPYLIKAVQELSAKVTALENA